MRNRFLVCALIWALVLIQTTFGEEGGNGKISEDILPTQLYKKLGFEKLREGKVVELASYTNIIPGTKINYEMVAIPGGKFLQEGKVGDKEFKREVTISPFWIQKYEISWAEYDVWLAKLDIHWRGQNGGGISENDGLAERVSCPTAPYLDMSFGMGRENRPAIAMTHLAAKTYAMWLSAKTGHFYRLPTEAEWEYACRAGSKSKYSFGDDVNKLEDYAWYFKNSFEKYHERGTKKPNAWGLFDMHGNVSEWVLDSYDENFYKNEPVVNPVNPPKKDNKDNPPLEAVWPIKLYGEIARGGSWKDNGEDLEHSKRKLSEPSWKFQDPNLPKSVWYHTDAIWVGFRLVRSATIPPLEDLHKYWPTDEEIKAIPKR